MDAWLFHTIWQFDAAQASGFDVAYRTLNLVEGAAWCVLALLVLRRFVVHRHSGIEIVYALAFLTFGASDFREAYSLQTWLILAKGLNLAALLWLRAMVIRRCYPASRVF